MVRSISWDLEELVETLSEGERAERIPCEDLAGVDKSAYGATFDQGGRG